MLCCCVCLTSILCEFTFLPFLFQNTWGLGSPAAWHTNDTTPPDTPIWSVGILVNLGATATQTQARYWRHNHQLIIYSLHRAFTGFVLNLQPLWDSETHLSSDDWIRTDDIYTWTFLSNCSEMRWIVLYKQTWLDFKKPIKRHFSTEWIRCEEHCILGELTKSSPDCVKAAPRW